MKVMFIDLHFATCFYSLCIFGNFILYQTLQSIYDRLLFDQHFDF